MSPLSPLTAYDVIFLDQYLHRREQIHGMEMDINLDIRFFLQRISQSLTGNDGMNFLPSHISEMGRKYEERHAQD